jgi:beta-hydroxyacyl-ACP dehydratase FabZ
MLDINQIRELLPHRYPFLFVDRVIEIGENSAVGYKNVSGNEPFFEGHFPEYPIMPGVLIAEALAQMGAILIMSKLPNPKEKLVLFAAIDNCKFRHPVVPGDQLRLEVEFTVNKPRVAKMNGKAFVDDKLVAEGTMRCQIADKPKTAGL